MIFHRNVNCCPQGHPGPGHTAFGHSGPGHTGPWTSRSSDNQVFRTSRSLDVQVPGHPGLSDFQVFRTSRSLDVQVPGRPGLSDVQVFRTSRSRKSNAHTLILDWCAFALDGVKNVTDGPTDKAFLGVGYNFKPNIDQNLLNWL